jgi:hypothetical protein
MMKRVLAATAVAIGLCALWSTLVVAWAFRGALTPIAPRSDAVAFMAAAVERVKGDWQLRARDDRRWTHVRFIFLLRR